MGWNARFRFTEGLGVGVREEQRPSTHPEREVEINGRQRRPAELLPAPADLRDDDGECVWIASAGFDENGGKYIVRHGIGGLDCRD